jgi:hypothetical protein
MKALTAHAICKFADNATAVSDMLAALIPSIVAARGAKNIEDVAKLQQDLDGLVDALKYSKGALKAALDLEDFT